MNFVSFEFLIFFGLVLLPYWIIRDRRWQNLLLLASSCIFYGWLVPWHVLVLLASTLLDYLLALGMGRWKSGTGVLFWTGLISNLSLLTLVKYYFSFNHSLAAWLDGIGFEGDIFLARIILPLGLSFYILKKIGYLSDVRRGTLSPVTDLVAFAAYVSFFPQVFSGPIDRPQTLLKQLQEPRIWKVEHVQQAAGLLVMGFFKKIVIANTVKVIVDQIFLLEQPSWVLLLVGGLGFTLQILADFSSYTDISRGVSFLLGLETMENFRQPYLALTPGEFWNRWHISLSSWLRDYVFFPLRRTLLRIRSLPEILVQSIPPLVTMFISGLWHGVGWQFIVWGLYHGVLIVLYQWSGLRMDASQMPVPRVRLFAAWLTMFVLIVFGWLIFRAPSLTWLWNVLLHAPLYRNSFELTAGLSLLSIVAFYASLLMIGSVIDHHRERLTGLRPLYYAAATLMIIVFLNSSSPDFIYFQF